MYVCIILVPYFVIKSTNTQLSLTKLQLPQVGWQLGDWVKLVVTYVQYIHILHTYDTSSRHMPLTHHAPFPSYIHMVHTVHKSIICIYHSDADPMISTLSLNPPPHYDDTYVCTCTYSTYRFLPTHSFIV